jgi:prepilin peptidase CpaA
VTAQVWVAIVIGIAATVEDLAHRRISNWICGAAFAAGVAVHLNSEGWHGAITALLGALSGFGVFLIFYLLGGMGGGDVKLMAGFGALLGTQKLMAAALWTAACGGIFAAVAIGCSAAWGLLRTRLRTQEGCKPDADRRSRLQAIPYAPAIAAGVWLSLVPKA